MPIEFLCTHCGKTLRVEDSAAGRKAKCPACSTTVDVPEVDPHPPDADNPWANLDTGPSGSKSHPPAQPGGYESYESPDSENPFASPEATDADRRGYYKDSRSGAVTAVGVINIIVGSLGTLGGLCVTFGGGMLVAMVREGEFDGQFEEFDELPDWIAAFVVGIGVFFLLLGGTTIAAGIGVLQRKGWGRILTFVVGGIAGLMAVLSIVNLELCGMLLYGGYAVYVIVVLSQSQYAAEFD